MTVSLKKSNASEKNVIVGGELDCIDIDDFGNLGDSPRVVFINEECGNLIVVNDDGQFNENISRKRQTLYNTLQMSTR